MNRKTDALDTDEDFRWEIAAFISGGLVIFMAVIRPFGFQLETGSDWLVLAGMAPLNFSLILLVHQVQFSRGMWARIVPVASMIGANTIYLSLWSNSDIVSLLIKVGLVAAVVLIAIGSWRKQQNLQKEVIALRKSTAAQTEIAVLTDDSGSETLRVQYSKLRFVKSEGNYVRIHWHTKKGQAQKLIRATLQSMMEQAPQLLQCHRSYLVSLIGAERIEGGSRGMTVIFDDGTIVPVSRSFVEEIRNRAQA